MVERRAATEGAPTSPETFLAKPNFRHQKQLRERAKKARQLEKEQRKSAARAAQEPSATTASVDGAVSLPEQVETP